MHRITTRAALCAALFAASAASQDFIYLTGFSDSSGPTGSGNSFPAGRFKDLDRDGRIDDGTELFPFLKRSYNTRNSTGSFMADMTWVQEGDDVAFYFADSADGRITRGVDRNHDGLLDNTEVTEFYDIVSAFAPEGIAARRDVANNRTVVYVANDNQTMRPGIHRLVDLNDDGDASDAGESSLIVDSTKGLSVQGSSGTVPVTHDWWYSVNVLPSGKIVAYNAGPAKLSGGGGGPQHPDMFCWYEFTDNNGTATNFRVFFNPSQSNGIATHPDFAAGGRFPRWDIALSHATLHPTWGNIAFMTSPTPSTIGPKSYYFGAGYPYTSGSIGVNAVTNPGGQTVSGLIYRWLDANGNETIDANEITLWGNLTNAVVDGVAPFQYTVGGTPITQVNSNVFGLEETDGKVHMCWNLAGPGAKGVVTMEDTNFNGVVETGEAFQAYVFNASSSNSVYSPSFGPFIKGFGALDRGLMPGPFQAGLVPYGHGCAQPGNGLAAVAESLGGSPRVGSAGFEPAVIRTDALMPCFLLTGIGRTSNPPNLGFVGRPQCPLLTTFFAAFGPFSSDLAGVASTPVPIPNSATLIGAVLNLQWLVLNPGSQTISSSNGLEVTIQA